MIDVQEIFNKAVNLGYYAKEYIPNKQCRFMCYALEYALKAGDITLLEYDKAYEAIKEYIDEENQKDIYNLEDYLSFIYSEDVTFEETLYVYKNWSERPYPMYT